MGDASDYVGMSVQVSIRKLADQREYQT
jgi:hypothetical protein